MGARPRTRDAKYEKYGDQTELEAEIERDAKLLYNERKLAKIEGFFGYYEFLSNDYSAEVYYKGYIYPTVSHAYHGARAPNEKARHIIHKSPTLSAMYEFAATFEDPKDWSFRHLRIMEALLRDKFRRRRDFRDKLVATGNRDLVNMTKDDKFWGMVNGKGQNQLGRLVEQIRKSIMEDVEVENWLFFTFSLQEDKRSLPVITLNAMKDNKKIDEKVLKGKSFYFFGANGNKCDYTMAHLSISRLHACIFHDQENGAMLVDLGSKAGTWLNGEKLKICFPYSLKSDAQIVFGQSTRKYSVLIDYTEVEKKFALEQRFFENELKLLEKLEDPTLDKNSLKEILGLVKQDTVYVENLGSLVTEEELRKWFQGCGNIISIRIPEDHISKKKRGIAFITFDTELAAKQAKRHSGMVKHDRKIKISIAEKKPEIERRIRKEVERKQWDEDAKETIRRDFEKRRYRHHRSEDRRKRRSRSRERRRREKSEDSSSENSESSESSSFISNEDQAVINKEELKRIQKE